MTQVGQKQNPYPYFAELRNRNKPLWLPIDEDYQSDGLWLFHRYQDALDIFRETDKVTKNFSSLKPDHLRTAFDSHMLNMDGNDHLRLRQMVSKFFSGRSCLALEKTMNGICDESIGRLTSQGEPDLILDYATDLPLRIITEIVGLPVEDCRKIRDWTVHIMVDSLRLDDEIKSKRKAAIKNFSEYIEEKLEDPTSLDKQSLIYHLYVNKSQGNISRDELVGGVIFLLVAGHETTIDLIGNGLWLLLNNKDQLNLLLNDPDLLDSTVEEVLRFESPNQRSTYRVAKENLVIAGINLKKGDQIAVEIGSANRDESIFAQPEVFDITRKPNPHLAFGTGRHNCLGKYLARIEAKVAIAKFSAYLMDAELVDAHPVWKDSSFLRGLNSLKIKL